MGFNSVYKVLQDIFPQVDSRILRAVAIEHFQDADLAVEVVLLEVIPRLSEQSRTNKGKSSLDLYEDLMDVDGGEIGPLEATKDSGDVFPTCYEQKTEAGPSKIGGSSPEAIKDADFYGQPDSPKVVEPVTMEPLCTSCFYDANGETDKVCFGIPIPMENLVNNNINPNCATSASISENGVYDNHDHGCVKTGISEDGVYDNHDHGFVKTGVSGSIHEAAINDKFTHLHVDSETTDPLSSQLVGICEKDFAVTRELDSGSSSKTMSESEKDLDVTQELDSGSSSKTMSEKDSAVTREELDLGSSSKTMPEKDLAVTQEELDSGSSSKTMPEKDSAVTQEELDSGSSSKTMSEKDSAVTHEEFDSNSSSKAMSEKDSLAMKIVYPEDEFIMTSMLTKAEQTCSTELLEEIIEDARNNKKALVSAMDSVVNLMKEVEFKEKAVEQAKEVAGRGCSDIIVKVDELKQALWRAKEANDMHAGEVYAEKAILATELKELQLRLLNLSDERTKSLEILEEMRVALEIRLATALKEIEAAEVEKLEKERSAKEALAYQESQMEMVVEESKKLKMEAEENSKLQEFLMDRGRAIDILQGEIYVKCQDVKLLKEKFDKRIPLTSSQISSILASSCSSFRSTVTPSESEVESYGTPKKRAELEDSYGFLEKSSTSKSGLIAESPKSPIETVNSVNDDCFPSGDEKQRDDDRKRLLDDGWELFENEKDLVF